LRRIETADPTEAVCLEAAHPDGPLLVYASIIPWDGCKAPDGDSPKWEELHRAIEWHARAILLRTHTTVSNTWIAQRLAMAHPGSVSRSVSEGRSRKDC
jgi:hypothetical protein